MQQEEPQITDVTELISLHFSYLFAVQKRRGILTHRFPLSIVDVYSDKYDEGSASKT